jgi:hypothetical protein
MTLFQVCFDDDNVKQRNSVCETRINRKILITVNFGGKPRFSAVAGWDKLGRNFSRSECRGRDS